jgi:peptide/nickel transport system substrate-binding protein
VGFIKRKGVSAAAVAALALFASACGSDSDTGGTGGGTAAKTATAAAGGKTAGPDQEITVASGAEAASLDIQKQDDDGTFIVLWRVYEALYDFDVDGKVEPLLADGMPTNVDDTTWEVKLKPDVVFSDGAKFDADAAVKAIERIIDPKYATGFSETATIAGAEKVDDLTIHIKTKAPDGLIANRLAIIKMVNADAAGYPKKATGTGPYLLESYEAGGNAELVYNDKYRGEKPQVTKVHIKNIPDESTRIQALSAGEVDVVPGLSPDQGDKVPSNVASGKPVYIGLIRINAIAGVTSDVKVRQAINMAIDGKAVAESLFSGYATEGTCQPSPVHVGNPDLKNYPFDTAKAKSLVDEAGATGKEVVLDFASGVFPQDRVLGQAIAQTLEQTGLKIKLSLKGYKPWLEEIYAHGAKAPALVFTESDNNFGTPASKVALFYSSKGPVSTYSNPEMDQMISDAEKITDPTERDAAYNAILKKGCDDAALASIYERKELYGLSKRVQFEPNPVAYSKMYYDEMKIVEPAN